MVDTFVGIPKNLIRKLVEVYFQHVYNAGLLLHRATLLDAVDDGSISPHVALSVCAWAAE